MIRTRWRLLVACLVVLVGAITVAGGSAGNREGTAELKAVPGPGAVTYGQNIAYTSTFSNESGSMFTHVTFTMSAPAVQGTSLTASFKAASCGAVDGTGTLTCDFGNIEPGQSVSLAVVWKAPGGPSAPGCADCLLANGTWLIKERKQTNSNETFPVSATADLIGASDDDATSARQHAGGYQLAGCDPSNPSVASLSTDSSLDDENNPVATSFCIPASFSAGAANGLQSTITEPPKGSSNYAHESDVCIAAPGEDCGDPSYLPQNFAPATVTLTFTVASDALPKNYKITGVSHNGGDPVGEGACDADGFCVLSIDLNHRTKIWTIVVTSETNGFYNW
jgi:hypothetical protein